MFRIGPETCSARASNLFLKELILAKKQQSSDSNQILGRREFALNLLQKRSMGTHFWKVNTFSNKFIIAKIAGDQGFAEQEISLKNL